MYAADSASIPVTEVVSLPSDAAYGGGDKAGSELIAATYNAGEGPGIWIVADGGYRLYHNGVAQLRLTMQATSSRVAAL